MINRISGPSNYQNLDRINMDEVRKRIAQTYHQLAEALVKYGKFVAHNIETSPEYLKQQIKSFVHDIETSPEWQKKLLKEFLKTKGLDSDEIIKFLSEIAKSL